MLTVVSLGNKLICICALWVWIGMALPQDAIHLIALQLKVIIILKAQKKSQT